MQHATPRPLRLTLIVLILPITVLAQPVGAYTNGTLVEANEDTSTYALSAPLTDGTYVVWRGASTSVHLHCTTVSAARLANREGYPVVAIGDGGDVALDEGLLVTGTPATACDDAGTDRVPAGLTVTWLATGESQTLVDGTDVVDVDVNGPVVAWVEAEPAMGGTRYTIRAHNLDTDGLPFEIANYELESGGVGSLTIVGTNLYWLLWYGSPADRDVIVASIGPDPDPIGIMSLHAETSAVAIDGTALVTITDGRPLYHDLTSGQTRWLGDGPADALATDGRYVVWSSTVSGTERLHAYDLVAGARFVIWETSAAHPATAGRITSISLDGGALAWARTGYNTWMTAIHATHLFWHLPSAPRPDPGTTDPGWTYFPQTDHYLAGDFRDYWEGNGGLPVFGYPLTEEFRELSADTGAEYTVQVTERQRFEWHPENAPPYHVLLGRLGAELLTSQGRDWTTFPTADPSAPHYMAATGHAIEARFWTYWASHGLEFGDAGVSFRESLALFGYPLSEAMVETNGDGHTVLTQYFERAVFEYHPDNPPEWQVLLRRLGAELLTARAWQ